MSLAFLAGIRVLDLSQYIPGPYAGLMLADLGADVVKVEPPEGDPMRRMSPFDDDGLSTAWKLMNAGKAVITVDLKSPAGRESFQHLVEQADVLLESYRPGVLDRLGFDRARLASLNPRLVHAALSGYGQTGPWRLRTGHDLNYMALAGGLAVSGPADAPMMAAPPTADYASGLQCAMSVCAALIGRARSGVGAYLDLSLAETVLAWQGITLTAALHDEPRPRRQGNMLNGGAACYQIYRCADGRFATLAALEEKFWRNFCDAVARADWVPRQWEPMPQDRLIAELQAMFAARPAADWETCLGSIDCCFGLVVEPTAVATHPQIAARAMVSAGPARSASLQALFPAWVDGNPPASRPGPRMAAASEIIARWRSG